MASVRDPLARSLDQPGVVETRKMHVEQGEISGFSVLELQVVRRRIEFDRRDELRERYRRDRCVLAIEDARIVRRRSLESTRQTIEISSSEPFSVSSMPLVPGSS